MINEKPRIEGKPFMYFGNMGKYVLGFREETGMFVVGDSEGEKEYENIFVAVEEIFQKCGYKLVLKDN